MGDNTDDSSIGLVFGFIVFFLDLVLFFIFIKRVRVSFNKANYIYDDEWRQNNDYWLKLSRISGVIFCLFHMAIMIIVIVDLFRNNNNNNNYDSILNTNSIAHFYWIFQALWTLLTNLAIVLITQRMYRVYKTTSTPFTPLKDWMSNNQKFIEYLIWTIYALISLTIIIQYFLIIADANNQFSTASSILTSIRNFGTAIILCMQLVIACFFAYIAHKSQQQTNWNAQSRAIICKETAKLAFIVIFLSSIVGIILYTACWWLINMDAVTTLNQPYDHPNERVFWAILEWFGFWLILYLTRLRKPPSDQDYLDKELPSSTSTKSKIILKRALSSKKQKQKQLKLLKLRELEKRKQAFKEREKKRNSKGRISNDRGYTKHHHQIPTANNETFNAIFMNQVAKLQRQQKEQQKEQQQNNKPNKPTIEEEKDEQQQEPIDNITRNNEQTLNVETVPIKDPETEITPSARLKRIKSVPPRKHIRYNQV